MAGKSAKPKRRQGGPRYDGVYYVVEISDWAWSLSFGVSRARVAEEPYSDYRHLVLRGKLLRPAKAKAEKAELTFLRSQSLNENERQNHKPHAVGTLRVNRGSLSGLLRMPSDVLTDILQMLIARHFRYAVLEGTRLQYGQGEVRSYRLEATLGHDDLPPEE